MPGGRRLEQVCRLPGHLDRSAAAAAIYQALTTGRYFRGEEQGLKSLFNPASEHQMDDQRSADRKRTSKAASIFFGRQTGEHSCNVEVTDLGNGGAGIYKSGKAILPLKFELSFDNLRRKCRMVWRRGNFFGVAFEDQNSADLSEPELKETDMAIEGPGLSIFDDPPQFACLANSNGSVTEFTSEMTDRTSDDRSDRRFAIGVAIALALPVLISLGAYVATTVVLRANG